MTRLPRELPPCPKAQVHRTVWGAWNWKHVCPWHSHYVATGGYSRWETAMKAATDHMAHCEAK